MRHLLSSSVLSAPLDKAPQEHVEGWLVFMVLLLIGLGVFLLWTANLRALIPRGRVRDMTFAEIRETGYTGRVRVRGVVEAGPGGPLRAPVTGLPCVWWELISFEKKEGESSSSNYSSVISEDLLAVADETESVVFSPVPYRVWGAKQSAFESPVPDRPDVTLHQSELALAEGTEVILNGRPVFADDGTLTMVESRIHLPAHPPAYSGFSSGLVGLIGGLGCLGGALFILIDMGS